MTSLRISTPKEPPFQASKWLSIQALLDIEEMNDLLLALPSFYLFLCGTPRKLNQTVYPHEEFLERYSQYINSLKKGHLPEPPTYQPWFAPAMSTTPEALFTVPVGNDQQIIRISKPVVQLQSHTLDYSPIDKKFRPMVFGADSIPWGIQFSYPQLYQNPVTKQPEQVKSTPEFPNTALFHQLQRWMRQHTIPTPFIAEGILTNVPMRLGKKCLSWINAHPKLVSKNISVAITNP